jgi:hypothetical protein
MMKDHRWDDSLGMFVPLDCDSTKGIDPTPFGSSHDRNLRDEQRDINARKLEISREVQYEKWRQDLRDEISECNGDPCKIIKVKEKYSSYDRGVRKSSDSSSPLKKEDRKGHVYVLQDIRTGLYKIGRTSDMSRRMKELGVGKTSRIVDSKIVDDSYKVEREAHFRYKNSRLPQSEYFNLDSPPSI